MADFKFGILGTQWLVDAHGSDPAALRSCGALGRLFGRIVGELGLHPLGEPIWHVFPGEGGITGVQLLSESHLACHTFPERGFAAFDLYCCRPSVEWPWAERLADALGAGDVRVRSVLRGELEQAPAARTIPVGPGSTNLTKVDVLSGSTQPEMGDLT